MGTESSHSKKMKPPKQCQKGCYHEEEMGQCKKEAFRRQSEKPEEDSNPCEDKEKNS
jgi:hypothetical protein